ncbi:amidase family protein [Rhizobium sp. L245/93]|uniref:amidase family protein n=1 Tax=Rhizobium sp. L245/93 TaxID=2819998 RepID=UPI001ADAA0EC|nr:amidase family protein [Rhizobium sp. L245/93]MBO9166783.1 hypothetical protein [Rhizobium sp. L245/93]
MLSLRGKWKSRSISAVELLDETISHIQRNDADLNAVVVKDFERARAAARQSDSRPRARNAGRLEGPPITVKQSVDVAGFDGLVTDPSDPIRRGATPETANDLAEIVWDNASMAFDGRLLSGVNSLAAVVEPGSFARTSEILAMSPVGHSGDSAPRRQGRRALH